MKLVAMILLMALAVATSTNALAESGWTLWFENKTTINGTRFWPEVEMAGSANTFEKCVELQQHYLAAHLKRLTGMNDKNPDALKSTNSQVGSEIISNSTGLYMVLSYTCFPENRDPWAGLASVDEPTGAVGANH